MDSKDEDGSKLGSQRMSSQEHAAWRESRGHGSGSKGDAPRMLAERLLSACVIGDLEEASRLAALRPEKMRLGTQGIELALDSGNPDIALMLARANGWGSKFGRSSPGESLEAAKVWIAPSAVSEDGAGGSEGAAEKIEAAAHKIVAMFARGESWRDLCDARGLCHPALPDGRLLGMAFERCNARLALSASRSGAHPTEKEWSEEVGMFCSSYLGEPYYFNAPKQVHSFYKWLGEPANLAAASPKDIQNLFAAAMARSDAALMSRLLDAGIKPSESWRFVQPYQTKALGDEKPGKSTGLVWAAAKLGDAEMAKVVFACAPAVEAAKKVPESLESMARVLVNQVVALAEMGIPVDRVDRMGYGLAHHWAEADSAPRAGWATLMKKLPGVFHHRNDAGKTGAEMMASKLSASEQAKFLGSLAKAESREIRSFAAPAPKSAPGIKRRL